jgi:endonuclease/exonuclease/phosphatase family metal-dependent hydrolase
VARVRQYRVLTDDALQHYGSKSSVVIAGDFNTHNHGAARLINRQCLGDPFRWKAWNMSEVCLQCCRLHAELV